MATIPKKNTVKKAKARPSILGAPPTRSGSSSSSTEASGDNAYPPKTPANTPRYSRPRHSTPRVQPVPKKDVIVPLPPDFQPSIPPPNMRTPQQGPVRPRFISSRDPRRAAKGKRSRSAAKKESKPADPCLRKGKRMSTTPARPAKKVKVDSPMSPFPDDSFSEVNEDCGLSTPKTSSTEAQEDKDLDSIIDQLAPGAKDSTPDKNLDSIPTEELTIGTPDRVNTPKVNTLLPKNCGSQHFYFYNIFCLCFFSGVKEKERRLIHWMVNVLETFYVVVRCSLVIILEFFSDYYILVKPKMKISTREAIGQHHYFI